MILQPVILSGGSGTRLWPLSREAFPKQFLALTGKATLLQDTLSRLEGVESERRPPIVVCNESHRFIVAEQLRELQVTGAPIILEPVGRNTAPALTLAAYRARHTGADPILIVMPADHYIEDARRFRTQVDIGARLASNGCLVTFGIVPTAPETGYGYIRRGASIGDYAYDLAAFVEKPDAATAREYLEAAAYFWNSGIFMMQASVWLEAIQRYRPDIEASCAVATQKAVSDGAFLRVDAETFSRCRSDSIDYAVMEKVCQQASDDGGASLRSVVIPLDAGWSDVGSWAALSNLRHKDGRGNVLQGDVFLEDTSNSFVVARKRLVAAVGVADLIVVETPDAVLVAHRDRAQEVKAVTSMLRREHRTEHIVHTKVHRPWGSTEIIDEGHRFQVRRITVNPGERLTLQMHHHRAEHWVVVQGTAKVTREGETFLLSENQSAYMPIGCRHRLENPGTISLQMVEVHSGGYLAEDDVVRFDDGAE